MNEIPDHTLKVEMGEFTTYHLTCHLTDEAMCHKVCGMHPDGGCGEPEVGDDTPCRTETYAAGCVIAEWVNDGGIGSVEFEHTIEIPVNYEWRASHDYPTIQAAPMNADERQVWIDQIDVLNSQLNKHGPFTCVEIGQHRKQIAALRDERDTLRRVVKVLGMGLRFTDVFVRTRSWVFSTSDFAPGDFDLLHQLIESEEGQ